MIEARKFLLLTLLTIAAPAFSATADLTVFDDMAENGFSACNFNVLGDSYESDTVHSGTTAVQLLDVLTNILGFCNSEYFAINDYGGISFWINGGTDGNETILFKASADNGTYVAYADVASLYGAPLPPNEWVHVQGYFSEPPFISQLEGVPAGTFDHIRFTVSSSQQGSFFIDDISLIATGIFKNRFECSDPTMPTC